MSCIDANIGIVTECWNREVRLCMILRNYLVRKPDPQALSAPLRRPPKPEMLQNRRPLPARIHMAEVEITRVGSLQAKLFGKIAQALPVEVAITQRKPAMMLKKPEFKRRPNTPLAIEAFHPRHLIKTQAPGLNEWSFRHLPPPIRIRHLRAGGSGINAKFALYPASRRPYMHAWACWAYRTARIMAGVL